MTKKDDFLKSIPEKGAESPEFRTDFPANPKRMMEEKLRFKLPEDIENVVFDDNPDKIHIHPLPPGGIVGNGTLIRFRRWLPGSRNIQRSIN